ncbi:MAG: hypothetical protein H0T69_20020 [Thermoleophilaceae bacterium]|nr:hypothetical protein [Thermoleophilaceae bacterium]
MEYAARLTRFPSRKTITAPVVALVLGAAAATGAYTLIDNGDVTAPASKVIVVETPAPNAADIPGKNESATAAAISQSSAPTVSSTDEAATAAAISQSSGVELRGSKATTSGTSG